MTDILLNVEHLTKRFNDQDAVNNISFTQAPGEIVAIKGQTGSGKTTLLKLLAGILTPTSGKIEIYGQSVTQGDKNNLMKIGLLLKPQGVYERLTAKQYLKLFQRLYNTDTNRVDHVIREAGLIDRQNDLLKSFSQSLLARVEIARCILHSPPLLLLDEPTAHLDLDTMEILRRLIIKTADEGTAVLFTTSSHEEASVLAHRTAKISKGRLEAWDIEDEAKQNSGPDMDTLSESRFHLEKIPAKVNEKIVLFNPTELTYVESQDGQSVLHAGSEIFPCPLTLTELEEKLKPFGFFRSHRSYIVNLQRVREVIPWTRNSYSLVLDDIQKTTIPLSKNSMKDLEGYLGV